MLCFGAGPCGVAHLPAVSQRPTASSGEGRPIMALLWQASSGSDAHWGGTKSHGMSLEAQEWWWETRVESLTGHHCPVASEAE